MMYEQMNECKYGCELQLWCAAGICHPQDI